MQTSAAKAELTEEKLRQNPPSYITNPKKADYIAALKQIYPEKYGDRNDEDLKKGNSLKIL